MFAIVDAEMSTRLRAPRCSRSGASGALVSENGVEAVSLMSTPPVGPPGSAGGNGLLTAIVPRRRGGRQPAFSVREANWIPASTPASPPGELLDLGITLVGAGRPDLSRHLRGNVSATASARAFPISRKLPDPSLARKSRSPEIR